MLVHLTILMSNCKDAVYVQFRTSFVLKPFVPIKVLTQSVCQVHPEPQRTGTDRNLRPGAGALIPSRWRRLRLKPNRTMLTRPPHRERLPKSHRVATSRSSMLFPLKMRTESMRSRLRIKGLVLRKLMKFSSSWRTFGELSFGNYLMRVSSSSGFNMCVGILWSVWLKQTSFAGWKKEENRSWDKGRSKLFIRWGGNIRIHWILEAIWETRNLWESAWYV